MTYNDDILVTNSNANDINARHYKTLTEENEDLTEVLHKLTKHKENITKQNVDGRYDEVLSNISSNISKLNEIVNNNLSTISAYNNSNKMTTFGNFFQKQNNIKFTQNDSTSPSPIRGKTEMENFSSYADNMDDNNRNNLDNFNSLNPSDTLEPRGTFDTINNDNNNNVISPIRSDAENTMTNNLKRNSPMQSTNIFNIFKKLNLGFNFNKFSNSQKKSNKDKTLLDSSKNLRFHNIIALEHSCHNRSEVRCEFDILRLLLLFIATRPHSRHHHEICSITMVELENLHILVTDRNGQ